MVPMINIVTLEVRQSVIIEVFFFFKGQGSSIPSILRARPAIRQCCSRCPFSQCGWRPPGNIDISTSRVYLVLHACVIRLTEAEIQTES